MLSWAQLENAFVAASAIFFFFCAVKTSKLHILSLRDNEGRSEEPFSTNLYFTVLMWLYKDYKCTAFNTAKICQIYAIIFFQVIFPTSLVRLC